MAWWQIPFDGVPIEADEQPHQYAREITPEEAFLLDPPSPSWWTIKGIPTEITDGTTPSGPSVQQISRDEYHVLTSPPVDLPE